MNTATFQKLKQELSRKKENLEKELSAFAAQDPKLKDDWDTKYPRTPGSNLEEASDEVEEYSTALPIEFTLETQLKDVQNALLKIENSAYGTCESCGDFIEEARLLASPEARFCGKCVEKTSL